MRVYVECKYCGEKIYLDEIREKRSDYPLSMKISCAECENSARYKRNDLEAEPSGNSTAVGTILGGATGALAGPVGVAIGAGVGGMLGNASDNDDQRRIKEFYDGDIFSE
ncbi:hypothetical protein GLW36_15940 [Halorubrum terrestre]|uniref:Glycine zipper domain-containing protein n=1 Tax=Halorubrum distributum TaxID=29283 RepID=A0A6B1ISM0_9EURY|nr:glycine zipper domain-containing protein [Halorubrum terrestre]MYL18124.1 hypothetical protein [Halorubrum terrestre]